METNLFAENVAPRCFRLYADALGRQLAFLPGVSAPLRCALEDWVSPLGESLLANDPKGTKRSCPSIRFFAQAKNALAAAQFQGHAVTGHPWPITALATSMSLNP
ncbi:hypothetical protein ACNFIA_11955 [Pseudomonas sp. NY15437]|uniref:hypothetical protein n=1 Tax=Pseudomonas sp. NY15437 TaxID=3400360 RepID=UPI003A87804D